MFNNLSYIDVISILSLCIGLENLSENREQSAQSDQLIQQIDVDSANERQANLLLEKLGQKFDEQNAMLKEILEVIKRDSK